MNDRRVINICFHGIGSPQRRLEPGEGAYWISTELFDTVLDEVAHRSDVRLSFDDGNISDVAVGLDGLLRRKLKATFFAIAGRLDQPGSLGSDHLRELRRHGMTIGTHGMDHVPWRSLGARASERELVEARSMLSEAAGASVDQAALPLGRYDRRLLRHLRTLDYANVYSSDRSSTRPTSWLQPRFSLVHTDTIDSVRSTILAPSAPRQAAKSSAVRLIKRLR